MDKHRQNLMTMAIVQYLRDAHPQLSIIQFYNGVKITKSGISLYIDADPECYMVYRRNKHEDKRMVFKFSEHNVFNIIKLAIDILF